MTYLFLPSAVSPNDPVLGEKTVQVSEATTCMQYFTTVYSSMQLPTQGCLQNSLSGSDGGRLEDPGSGSTGGALICIVSLEPPLNPPRGGSGYETDVSGKLFHLSNPKIMMLIDIGLCISVVHNLLLFMVI